MKLDNVLLDDMPTTVMTGYRDCRHGDGVGREKLKRFGDIETFGSRTTARRVG